MMKLNKLITRQIGAERINNSSRNFENQSGSYSTTLHSALRPILLRYPWLNFQIDDLIMIQTAYVIYQNAKLAYDVNQVSCKFDMKEESNNFVLFIHRTTMIHCCRTCPGPQLRFCVSSSVLVLRTLPAPTNMDARSFC